MKRMLLSMVVLIPAVAGADKTWTSGKGTTWDCKDDPIVSIAHGKGVYTFKGRCADIGVSGSKVTVTAETSNEINITGSQNTITLDAVGTINVSGSGNKVTWKAGTNGKPTIHDFGKNNVIVKAGGAAPTTTTAAAAKPAPTGTTIDCAKSPHFMSSDNDGTFTLTGACDMIMISGNSNKLKVDSVKTLQLSGNANTVDAIAVDAIDTTGNENKVTYKKAVTAKAKTKISNPGNGNKISVTK
jgi:hypothetical protein